MSNQQSFPLSWPMSWPRTADHKRTASPFHRRVTVGGQAWKAKARLSMADVVGELYRELKLIGVGDWNVVVSTNVELRLDGTPYSNRAAPKDPGAAVYFQLKGKPCVLACDKWNRVEDNLSAITRHIEALRGQERWGVGSVEQAFAGYTALPPAGSSAGGSWWDVLGTAHDAPFEAVQDAFREKAKVFHPDNKLTGDAEKMAALNYSWDQARKAFGK